MFVLNIPTCGTSMTAYSQADLSQALSAPDKSKAHSLHSSQARGTRQSVQSIQICCLYIEQEWVDTHPSKCHTSQFLI